MVDMPPNLTISVTALRKQFAIGHVNQERLNKN